MPVSDTSIANRSLDTVTPSGDFTGLNAAIVFSTSEGSTSAAARGGYGGGGSV